VRFALFNCCLVLCAVPGCGDSSGRVAFSGNVTVSGLPVTGEIRFSPVEAGPMATTTIENGEYHFTSENGPLPGDYDVIIESVPAAAKKGATAESVVPLRWKLRRSINARSKFDSSFALEPMSAIESE
jgi:hypothetical protein